MKLDDKTFKIKHLMSSGILLIGKQIHRETGFYSTSVQILTINLTTHKKQFK